MTDTDIDRQDTVLEKEIVTAIKDIARKKAVLSSFEQAASAKDARRKRLVRGLSGVAAALVGVVLLYVFLPAKTAVSSPDAGACIRGGEMASDRVIGLIRSGKYGEALELIDKERAELTVDEGLSEEAKTYERQVIANETRKLDSLENCLRNKR